MKSIGIVALTCVAAASAGCASRSENIGAAYVSPVAYQSYSCQQIAQESARVSSRAAQLSGVQDSKATSDAIATGVAVVLFWPAAFLIKGDSATAGELASLKGQRDAIEQASIAKRCGIRFRN